MTPIPPIPGKTCCICGCILSSNKPDTRLLCRSCYHSECEECEVYVPEPTFEELQERIAKLTAVVEQLQEIVLNKGVALLDAEAENTRLKAPVSRHNEADGILQRFFITGGRQYRYTKQDGTYLEDLLNEWIACRAARTPPQEGQ